MISEPFAAGSSWIHRVDPRYKILGVTVFSILVAVSNRLPTLSIAVIAGCFLALSARLEWREAARRILVVAWFLLLIWLVLPLTFEGTPLFSAGPLSISREGIALSLAITMKSISILMALMALAATMTVSTLGHALGHLGVPDKIVTLLLMTYRYIFVLEKEYDRLVRAAKIRGFRPGTNLHSYKTYAYFAGMLFVRATDRADRVFKAMRCRGFDGRFYTLSEYAPHRRNLWFALMMTVLLAGIIAAEWL